MVASIQPEQRAISAYKHTTHAHTHTHTLAYILINKSAGATRNATDDRCLIWNWRKSYPLMAIKHEYRMLHSWEAITSTKYVLLLFRFVLQLLLLLVDSFILLYFLCYPYTRSQCWSLANERRWLFSLYPFIHSTQFTLSITLHYSPTYLLQSPSYVLFHKLQTLQNEIEKLIHAYSWVRGNGLRESGRWLLAFLRLVLAIVSSSGITIMPMLIESNMLSTFRFCVIFSYILSLILFKLAVLNEADRTLSHPCNI